MIDLERNFIIGDIHGCLEMLKSLMDGLDWDPDRDGLIFLGDYIDRGEDPKGVVDLILEISGEGRSVQCLMGNHEDLFLEFLEGADPANFILNGGINTMESYHMDDGPGRADMIPSDHYTFMKNLQPMIELDDYYVVHAGFRPEIGIEGQTLQDLLWIREPFIYSSHDFGKKVIFGHTPFYDPLIMENKIGLDTGAVYGNRLTCLELPAMKFHSVEA
jgi:serine/threonine protein phosphatase 1